MEREGRGERGCEREKESEKEDEVKRGKKETKERFSLSKGRIFRLINSVIMLK